MHNLHADVLRLCWSWHPENKTCAGYVNDMAKG